MRFTRLMYHLAIIALAVLSSAAAWAGVAVVPVLASAPTLGGWLLLLLALLLAVVAYRTLRERVQGRKR